MATLREIKRRITSVQSTQQITKAMKMVAAAKLRKAQTRLVQARPYSRELTRVIGHVVASSNAKRSPYFARRPARRICYAVVTADRGLCGSFNANILRHTVQELEQAEAERVELVAIGKKANDFFKRRGLPIRSAHVDFLNHLEFHHAQEISAELMRYFLQKRYDRIFFIYQEFKTAIQHNIVVEPFLPFVPVKPEDGAPVEGFIYDPNPDVLLETLIPMALNYQVWRILLESTASEHGARMTAMETATENAAEMIKALVLYYNKARQAAITKEINEIVGGAEALRK